MSTFVVPTGTKRSGGTSLVAPRNPVLTVKPGRGGSLCPPVSPARMAPVQRNLISNLIDTPCHGFRHHGQQQGVVPTIHAAYPEILR